MSGNFEEGYTFYSTCSQTDKMWFEFQWAVWPERVEQTKTINMSFLAGGVKAYREINKTDPVMSELFKESEAILRRYMKEDSND